LHAFDTHFMRATCTINIISSMLSAKTFTGICSKFMRATCTSNILASMLSNEKITCIDAHFMRTKCPTNILTSMISAKIITCFFTPTLCVLHALLIPYHFCFLPKRLHAFDSHTMLATCPNIISSMLSTKNIRCIWHTHYACYMPF
jgi:hypothetical protein